MLDVSFICRKMHTLLVATTMRFIQLMCILSFLFFTSLPRTSFRSWYPAGSPCCKRSSKRSKEWKYIITFLPFLVLTLQAMYMWIEVPFLINISVCIPLLECFYPIFPGRELVLFFFSPFTLIFLFQYLVYQLWWPLSPVLLFFPLASDGQTEVQVQLNPLIDQLNQVKDLAAPEFGNLQAWETMC